MLKSWKKLLNARDSHLQHLSVSGPSQCEADLHIDLTDNDDNFHQSCLTRSFYMRIPPSLRKLYGKFKALPLRKRILYSSVFVLWHALLIVIAVFSRKLQSHLEPLAAKMERHQLSWLALSALIAVVSIPPLFGHELLAFIAGYVYGQQKGFAILTASSIIGESAVYFTFRFWLRGYLESFRAKYRKNYAVFVAVVEDGGLPMLWAIRMSIIPPHFSTPLFSSLENITWWKWMLANILASPVKFFPPVFAGSIFRDKRNNSIFGDIAFAVSSVVTVAVLLYIRQCFLKKKREIREASAATELQSSGTVLQDVGRSSVSQVAEKSSDKEVAFQSGALASDSAEGCASKSTRTTENGVVCSRPLESPTMTSASNIADFVSSSDVTKGQELYELQTIHVERFGLPTQASRCTQTRSDHTPQSSTKNLTSIETDILSSEFAFAIKSYRAKAISQITISVPYDAAYDPTVEADIASGLSSIKTHDEENQNKLSHDKRDRDQSGSP